MKWLWLIPAGIVAYFVGYFIWGMVTIVWNDEEDDV